MCWRSESTPIPIIANKDIEIYKICLTGRVGYSEVRSYFADFIYTLNQVYVQEKPISIKEVWFPWTYQIEEAFHSYLPSCPMIRLCEGYVINGARYYGYTLVKVKGFIPKGAKYYVNKENEVVSDKIVLTEYVYI